MCIDGARFWRGRRVLVTGATGFIGSNLVHALLERDAHVAALVPDEDPSAADHSPLWLELAPGSVHDIAGRLERFEDVGAAVREAAADIIFHLGAQALVGEARRNPRETFEINAGGTWNLLEACRSERSPPRAIIVASSDKAYGEQDDLPYREQSPLKGGFPYDASKACADLIAQSYAITYGLPIGIARCGNVFGPGDVHWSRLVPGCVRDLLGGRQPIIRSDGSLLRDWLYVQDAVDAYLRLAGHVVDLPHGQPSVFNFSVQQPVTVLEMVLKLIDAVGRRDLRPRVLDEAKAEIGAQHLDASLARSVLSWSCRFDLDAGLGRTIEWYRSYLSEPAAAAGSRM